MTARRVLLAAGLALPGLARAQAAAARIGYLHPRQSAAAEVLRLAALREGLGSGRGLRPVELIPRIADGTPELLARHAAELAAARPDVIVAVAPPGVAAAQAATRTIPIIGVDLESDPVAAGWVASLGRPGGNVTGMFLDFADIAAKCLQLLAEARPGLARCAVLWDPSTGSFQRAAVEAAGARMGLGLGIATTTRLAEVEPAIEAAGETAQALLFLSSPLFAANTARFARAAMRARLPGIMLFADFARQGGLAAYGPDLQDMFRRAGGMARRVVEGARVETLPVERPVRFDLALNLHAAGELGLELPPLLLARATEVIE